MRKLIVLCGFLLFGIAVRAQHLAREYRIKTVIPVAGRQGIACDGTYYYVSDSKALYKYTKEGTLVLKNDDPFRGLTLEANHLGDIDVWNGEIYAGIEVFLDGQGKNIQVAVYDAGTLAWKRSINWEPASGQVEVSGLAVDRQRDMVWMSDWVDSRYLYCYDLATGKYSHKVHLRPVPWWTQGIYMVDGRMLITADDGDATFHEPDNVYIADLSHVGKTYADVKRFREMRDFRRAGEIEGISMDPATDDLLVLTNRGSRIELGMVKGYYSDDRIDGQTVLVEDYDTELHELYVFEPVRGR